MIISHDESNDSYSIINLTWEELKNIGICIDSAPLPLKRMFYSLVKDIAIENNYNRKEK